MFNTKITNYFNTKNYWSIALCKSKVKFYIHFVVCTYNDSAIFIKFIFYIPINLFYKVNRIIISIN